MAGKRIIIRGRDCSLQDQVSWLKARMKMRKGRMETLKTNIQTMIGTTIV